MTRCFAIGGGELDAGETRPVDRRVVEAAGPDPTALFVPTASGDAEGYVETFRSVYGDLGCAVEVLELVDGADSPERIGRAVEAADLVYVGGGDTAAMLSTWRDYLVDDLLRAAAEDTVLAGLSAGALAWFEAGYEETASGDDPVARRVDGLGVLPGTAVAHFDDETWREAVTDALDEGETVVGIDDCAAVEVRGDEFRVVTARDGAGATRVRRTASGLRYEPIRAGEWSPLSTLAELPSPSLGGGDRQ